MCVSERFVSPAPTPAVCPKGGTLSSQLVFPIVIPINFQSHRYLCAFLAAAVTPAGWPKGGTLSSPGGPCLSPASWAALRKFASVPSYEARRGVNGFGPFAETKVASTAGAKPGNTENHIDTRVGATSASAFSVTTRFY